MSPRNTLYKTIDVYRELMEHRAKDSEQNKNILRSNRTKNKILNFFVKEGRWPSRNNGSKTERKLGTCLENFISKESVAYDKYLRRIVFASGLRKSNNKRKHNIPEFKKQILAFIKEHGRVPTTYGGETIENEGKLRAKLDYYTQVKKDMTLLGKVYGADPCHRSGILIKYRPLINRSLDVQKPLVNLVR